MRNFTTENPDWGFHGEMSRLEGIDPAEAFNEAAKQVASAAGVDGLTAAAWLDSRDGRHFGGDVSCEYAMGKPIDRAIHATIGRWLGWNISPAQSAQTGIPAGLPYLVGVVNDFAIAREV